MDPGGVETGLMRMLRAVDRQQCAMDFCCLSGAPGSYAPEITALGGEVLPCKVGRNPFAFARRLSALLCEGRYDVVHSHVHHFSGYILRIAARAGIPGRIAHSRSASDFKEGALARPLYRALMTRWIRRYATVGLAVSGEAAEALFGPSWQEDPRYRVIHNCIELSRFDHAVDAASVRQSLGLPAEAAVIGHVANLHPVKNHTFLLDVAREVFARRPDAWLLLVGDGPLRSQLEARAAELGIAARVVFTGRRADVPDLLLGAVDLFCLPSLWEGLPLSAVEAQAAGLRCLLSDSVTRETAVVPGAVEFLPLSAGPSAWAEAICRRLDEPRVPREEAFAAIRAQGFDVESATAATLAIYAAAAGQGAG